MNRIRREKSLRSLTKKRDFELVFKDGISSSSRYLIVYIRPNEFNFNRLGLSVSKKIGKAVIRNKIKRLLREAIKRVLACYPDNHYDIVVVAKNHSVDGKIGDFILEITKGMEKL